MDFFLALQFLDLTSDQLNQIELNLILIEFNLFENHTFQCVSQSFYPFDFFFSPLKQTQ